MTDNDLDILLSAPLASVDDADFSARVSWKIAQEQAAIRERREIIEWSALLLAAAVFLALVPLTSVMRAIETLTVNVGSSLPVAVALGALILAVTFTQSVVDRTD